MILDISITNYQSIRDRLSVDLTVGKHAPDDPRYVSGPALNDDRASLLQVFMGKNASGKTTILKAIALVRWLIVNSFRRDEEQLPVANFGGYKDPARPTVLEITFLVGGQIHIYAVSLTKDKILNESLSIKTLTRERKTTKRLFERRWNAETKLYEVDGSGFGLNDVYWQSMELSNSSLIAASYRFGNKAAKELTEYWKSVRTNIEVEDRFHPYPFEAYMAARYYAEHPESRKNAEADIKKYDLGIEGFGDGGSIRHKYGKESFELEVDKESSGTQQLIVLNKKIEDVLTGGGVALIDELDAYLHPLMTEEIIRKFLNKKVNLGNGQLIFSTHDVAVFDFLEKYEIHIVDKDEGVTESKRLDEFPGYRNTENFKKRYLEGKFGGIPVIVD